MKAIKDMTSQEKVQRFVSKHFEDGKIKVKYSELPTVCFSTVYYDKNNIRKYTHFVLNTGKNYETEKYRPDFWRAKDFGIKPMVCSSTSKEISIAFFKSDVNLNVASITQIWITPKHTKIHSYDDLEMKVGCTYFIVKGCPEVFDKDGIVDFKNGTFYTMFRHNHYERTEEPGWHWTLIKEVDESHESIGFQRYLTFLKRTDVNNFSEFKKVFNEDSWFSSSGAILNKEFRDIEQWYSGYRKQLTSVNKEKKTKTERDVENLITNVKLSDLNSNNSLNLLSEYKGRLAPDVKYRYGWIPYDKNNKDTVIEYRGIIAENTDGYLVLRIINASFRVFLKRDRYSLSYVYAEDAEPEEIISEIKENARVYIRNDAKDTIIGMVYSDNINKWIYMNKNVVNDYTRTPILNPDEVEKNESVKYIVDLCCDYSKYRENNSTAQTNGKYLSLDALFRVKRYPASEQLYKSGFKRIAYDYMFIGDDYAKNIFGCKSKIKNGELFKKIDLNKYQLKLLETIFNNSRTRDLAINYKTTANYNYLFKFFSKSNSFKDVDDETSRFAIVSTINFYREFRNLYQAQPLFLQSYPILSECERYDKICMDDTDYVKHVITIAKIQWKEIKDRKWLLTGDLENRYFKLLKDINATYKQYIHNALHCYSFPTIEETRNMITRNECFVLEYDNISSYNDLDRLHDSVIDLLNTSRINFQESLEKANKRQLKERQEKFSYSDNEYLIKVPETLSEITREGAKLGHCVGGYVERVAAGSTNILFLRHKNEPNHPFYTIEVSMFNTLIQVHGARNKHLGLNPEAVPFILRWLRDKNITYNDSQVLDTGAGYCSNGILIEKPEI